MKKTYNSIYLILAIMFLTTSCRTICGDLKDHLEPNDSPEQATEIFKGKSIEAGADLENPDFFRINIDSPEEVVLEFTDRGGFPHSATFGVWGPDGTTLVANFIHMSDSDNVDDFSGSIDYIDDEEGFIAGHLVKFPADTPGEYIIKIQTSGSNHICYFSWHYLLTYQD